MSVFSGPNVVTSGLIHLLEATQVLGTASQTITNPVPGSEWTATAFGVGDSTELPSFLSNVDGTGAGTSHVRVSPNAALTTGSITATIWFNLRGIALNVGASNNWRGLLCTNTSGTAGSPLTMVLEQDYLINFSTTHTDSYRRYINGQFKPVSVDQDGWQMVSYTYDQVSGIAACYKNDSLIVTGPMTTNTGGSSPTGAGTGMVYTNYSSGGTQTGFRVYGGTATSANPAGNGCCPGELSNILFYNRALTAGEIQQNFRALRGRFGI